MSDQGRSRQLGSSPNAWVDKVSSDFRSIRNWLSANPKIRQGILIGLISAFVITNGVFCYGIVVAIRNSDVSAVPQMKESTRIFDRDGRLIFELYEKKRSVIPLSKACRFATEAILSIEDRNFYRHNGFDPRAIARAVMINLRSGRVAQGASTITQQLARNVFLTRERSTKRKLEELLLALEIERKYTKEQILTFYINRIYLGSGFYGLEAAAQGYFGKPASDLNLGEAALLAGLAKAPALYSPYRNPALAVERRNQVVGARGECGYVGSDAAQAAKREPLRVGARPEESDAPSYAVDYVKEKLLEKFGYDTTYNGGLRVYTTIDSSAQASAEAAVEGYLAKVEKRRGFGSAARTEYVNRQMRAPTTDHSTSDAPRYLQGALISMDAHTGEIYALVGGRSFAESNFNRAVHAKRQAGSSFKPFVYTAALELGMTPATMVPAGEQGYATSEGLYTPVNSEGAQYGSVSLRTALRKSINTATVQLGQQIGLQNVIRSAQKFGIEENLPPVVSLPLGSADVTLFEMVRAYSAFANGGKTAEPMIIARVLNRNGEVLYSSYPVYHQVTDPATAFLVTSMLQDAVDRGTGSAVRTAGYRGPVAGKTGTTDDFRDAWFIGFTPEIVTGVWTGFDAPRTIMEHGYGGTLAAPIWADFMKRAFPKTKDNFERPPGVVRLVLCSASGQLSTPYCPAEKISDDGFPESALYSEYFLAGNTPTQCQIHSPLPGDQLSGDYRATPGSP